MLDSLRDSNERPLRVGASFNSLVKAKPLELCRQADAGSEPGIVTDQAQLMPQARRHESLSSRSQLEALRGSAKTTGSR